MKFALSCENVRFYLGDDEDKLELELGGVQVSSEMEPQELLEYLQALAVLSGSNLADAFESILTTTN